MKSKINSQEEARVKLNSHHNPKVELPDIFKHLAELKEEIEETSSISL